MPRPIEEALTHATFVEFNQHEVERTVLKRTKTTRFASTPQMAFRLTPTFRLPVWQEEIKQEFPMTRSKTTAKAQRGHLDQIISEGGIITGIHDHENSDNYTSTSVGRAKKRTPKKHRKVDDVLEEAMDPTFAEEDEILEETGEEEGVEMEEENDEAEDQLVEALKRGEEVVSICDNEDGTCTVNLKTKQGEKDVIKNVNEDDVYEYIENAEGAFVEE
ncbi:hypothetical protein BC829DRAFT_419484 [Chytridium lagenaria]|nr:hypothetical protein BC829DRAFT_419484 [Chytridium lagenaria]